MRSFGTPILGVFLLSLAFPLHATDLFNGKVSVNGYGSWYYARSSNENTFLGATEVGSYRTSNFHLNLAAQVNDDFRVLAQVGWLDSEAGSDAVADFVFAEWRFSPDLVGRIGKVKMPFGIYSEIPNVGTLRPLLVLPQAAYGPIGFLGESYKGVGFSGTLGNTWKLQWDVFGGGTELKEDVIPELYLVGTPAAPDQAIETEVTRDVLGGRLVVGTPWAGFTFGGSTLVGNETVDGETRRRQVYGLQAESTGDALSVRAEVMHENVQRDLSATGAYVEASYFLTPHWQVAGEVGRLRTEFFHLNPQGNAAELARHDELTLGLNYWFDTSFVVKLNFLRSDGNAYVHPSAESLPSIADAGRLRPRTDTILFGGQFSF